jgi:hypothetical protein
MITKEFKRHCEYLTSLRTMDRSQVMDMERIIKENFNPSYSVCLKCRAQLSHGQRLLKNWLDKQEVVEDVIKTIEPNQEPVLVKESNFDIDVDIVEAEKSGCSKCKKKKMIKK